MAWDTNYEGQPRNTNNPGYGAQELRQIKKEVRERMERFNIFGTNETDRGNPGIDDVITGGTPKEGAARAAVTDEDTSARSDIVEATTALIGQMVMDLRELTDITVGGTNREQDGEDLDDALQGQTANLVKEIGVVMYDATFGTKVAPIFSYDDFIDKYQDQLDINGLKDFILPPSVPSIGDWDDYLAANERLGAVVPFSQLHPRVKDAKDFERYSVNTYNDDEGRVVASGTHPYTEGKYVNSTISVDKVYANAVYGAVYG